MIKEQFTIRLYKLSTLALAVYILSQAMEVLERLFCGTPSLNHLDQKVKLSLPLRLPVLLHCCCQEGELDILGSKFLSKLTMILGVQFLEVHNMLLYLKRQI